MSEPPTKIPKHLDCARPKMHQIYEDRNELEFFVRLCQDVLLEILQFGSRVRITKLERLGRRLHRIIESFFKLMPFLRLRIEINQFNGVYIGIGRHKISLTEANEVPPFLRFDIVQISYGYVWQPIKEKCELSESYLLILKPALIDSDMIEVYAGICEGDPSDFSNHLQLIEYIQNQLLSFCISPRSYKFHIYFYSDENSVPNLIASLLQMDELRLCSNIEIEIRIRHQEKRFGFEKQLPVEAIANWLEKSDDKMEIIDRTKERILKIELRVGIQNPQEMLEHLIKKFEDAVFPVHPFTFCFSYCLTHEIDLPGTHTNKKTGEELSINGGFGIEVKRASKEKKKKN